jgi:hypothetical protein
VARDERRERLGTGPQLVVGELGGGTGRAVDEVRHADAVGEQLLVLVGAQPPRGEPRGVQRRPEPVARPGEVVARLGGPQRRVDADEEDPEPGDYDVAEGLGARRPTTST